jgi:hypothetical protein
LSDPTGQRMSEDLFGLIPLRSGLKIGAPQPLAVGAVIGLRLRGGAAETSMGGSATLAGNSQYGWEPWH